MVVVLAVSLLISGPSLAGRVIGLAVVTKPGSAQNVCAQRFKELLKARSGYTVEIFHSGALGDETQMLKKLQKNEVQMGIITAGPFDEFVPEVRVVGFPFLFESHKEADAVLDGPVGDKLLQSLEKARLKGIAFCENGFRHLTNNLRPVQSVADVGGLRIRVMESVFHQELWRLLGARPIPLGWPINEELREGAADGQENPLWPIWSYGLYEFQRYLSLTGHVYSALIGTASLEWFNTLPKADQALIRQCMVEASRYERLWARKNEAGFLAKLKSAGMIVNEHPDIASFRKRAQKVRDLDIFKAKEVREMLDVFLNAVAVERADLK